MTVTATPPTTAPAEAAIQPATGPTGLAGVLGSADHKVVGRLWILVSVIGLVTMGAAGALVSVERFDTGSISVVDADWFPRIFTFHGIGGAFLFLMPLMIGVATSVVPLQVGAATIAFPRAAAASLWVHAIGGDVVGHLPVQVAAWLAPWMLAGGRARARVEHVGSDDVASWNRLVIAVRCLADER